MSKDTRFKAGNTVARDAAAKNRKKKQEARLILSEFASSKKKVGQPKKANTIQKDVDDLLNALGYE